DLALYGQCQAPAAHRGCHEQGGDDEGLAGCSHVRPGEPQRLQLLRSKVPLGTHRARQRLSSVTLCRH
ncbi:MAG: hypothetical protein QF750_08075, partial [Prochlorococcaceae cyanobacterium ETNP14_MAG_5]|nr:hypothetical protein [Prochlorococcaceae cyanobacterium ETNP14_MAG_5]